VWYNLTAMKNNTNEIYYYTNSRDLQLLIEESFAKKQVFRQFKGAVKKQPN